MFNPFTLMKKWQIHMAISAKCSLVSHLCVFFPFFYCVFQYRLLHHCRLYLQSTRIHLFVIFLK